MPKIKSNFSIDIKLTFIISEPGQWTSKDLLFIQDVQTIIKRFFHFANIDNFNAYELNLIRTKLAFEIAKAINIPSIDPEAAYRARNKYEMRQAIYNHNPDLVPAFVEINSLEDIENYIAHIGFPAVLKPISASGSKGIFIVNTLEEAFKAFKTLGKLMDDVAEGWFYNRYGNKFILESYISGQEFSVEGLILNNDIFIAGITDKLTTDDWHLEYRHIFPANYPTEVCMAIEKATKEVILTLGMNNCPFHLEGKWTDKGFKLIEIAARIGGDLIHTHLIENSLDFNWLIFVITALTQKQFPPISSQTTEKFSGIQFILAPDSLTFSGLNYRHTTNSRPGLIKIEELALPGTTILMPPQDFAMQRLGYIMAESDNYESLEQLLASITAELAI